MTIWSECEFAKKKSIDSRRLLCVSVEHCKAYDGEKPNNKYYLHVPVSMTVPSPTDTLKHTGHSIDFICSKLKAFPFSVSHRQPHYANSRDARECRTWWDEGERSRWDDRVLWCVQFLIILTICAWNIAAAFTDGRYFLSYRIYVPLCAHIPGGVCGISIRTEHAISAGAHCTMCTPCEPYHQFTN